MWRIYNTFKMYFSDVLLVFLASMFSCSMQPQGIQQSTYIPFNFAYTNQVENFLKRVTEDFKRSLMGNLRDAISCIRDLCSTETPIAECATKSTPTIPYYKLSEAGKTICSSSCSKNNIYYVHS